MSQAAVHPGRPPQPVHRHHRTMGPGLVAALAAGICGLFLLVYAVTGVFGYTRSADYVTARSIVIVVSLVMAFGLHLLLENVRPTAPAGLAERAGRLGFRAMLLFVGVVSAFLATVVLIGFPNSADEYGYLFQKDTLMAGRLWNPPHPMQEFFRFDWIADQDGKRVSQYLLVWPLLIGLLETVGIPNVLAGPVIGVITVACLFGFARAVSDHAGGLMAAGLVAVTAFFLINAASYFNHVPSALFAIGFVWCAVRFLKSGSAVDGLAAGACLGLLGNTRLYDAVLVALPFAAAFALKAPWRPFDAKLWGKHWTRGLWVVAGGLPFLIGLLAYNKAITGDPFQTVTFWAFSHLSFNNFGFSELHPASDALWMAAFRVAFLAEWTSPLLLILYGRALIHKVRCRQLAFYDVYLPVFVIGYVFFMANGGNQYGPRYYFIALPFMAVTIAQAHWLMRRQTDDATKDGQRATGMAVLAVAHTLYALAWLPAESLHTHQVITQRNDLYAQVERLRPTNALVMLEQGTGAKRYMPVNDLTRNNIDFTDDVLYAESLGADNVRLYAHFADRAIWVYQREKGAPRGVLRPLGLTGAEAELYCIAPDWAGISACPGVP